MWFKPAISAGLLVTLTICAHVARAGSDDQASASPPATAAQDKTGLADIAADNPVTVIPQGFSSYTSESLGDNRHCVVGAVTDEDGMNQKPLVYVEDTVANRVLWSRSLDLPANTFQGRATHCLRKGGTLYVLLQSDTQPAQTTSQTLLQVVELDLAKGATTGIRDIAVAGVTDAYSAWVDKGQGGMHLAAKGLAIAGEYYRLADPDKHLPFQVTVH